MARSLLVLLLAAGSLALDRSDEECEVCGLAMWRMQTIVTKKEEDLKDIKAAKEKRAKKSTKAHSKRWIKQEYALELSQAIDSQIEALPGDSRIIQGACRSADSALSGSALRSASMQGPAFHPGRCSEIVKARLSSILGEYQDELTSAAVASKGAGSACADILDGCSAKRAKHLLGSSYREEGMSAHELDMLQVGYGDAWTLHEDVDGSVYWFSHSKMESKREPPPGWIKDEDGKWVDGTGMRASAKPITGEKDEV